MSNTDAVWRALGKAHAIRGKLPSTPYVLLTTQLPKRSTEGASALRAAGPNAFFDAIEMLSPSSRARLAGYAAGGRSASPVPGFWSDAEIALRSASTVRTDR